MVVDAHVHVHVWSNDEETYPFAEGRHPPNDGGTERLRDEMAVAGVDRAVIVQPIYHSYDHRYVLETALQRSPDQFAGVALVDPFAADAPTQLRQRVEEDGFGGMRLYLSKQDDPSALAAPDREPLWEEGRDLDACFIVLGDAEDLTAIEPMIERVPDVTVVIDHLAQLPPVEGDPDRPIIRNLMRFSKYPNVFVKVSNMNRLSDVEYPHDDMVPVVREVYEAFGAERLMWGTDFPHVMRSCGYQDALAMVQDQLDWLSDEERRWLLGRTAREVWSFGED